MAEVWSEVVATVRGEFSDLSNATEWTRVILRLTVAAALGGLIGYEREQQQKAAGLRTHMLVSVGAALFVLAPLEAGMEIADLSRVMQGVVAGIGFLCAGAILKSGGELQVKGLTTAAGLWMTSAIGITAGLGLEATALLATVLTLAVLEPLHRLEKRMSRSRGHAPAGDTSAHGNGRSEPPPPPAA